MNIFITGATGYIGDAVARAALEAGHRVNALAHSPRAAESLAALGYTPLPGDLRDPRTLAEHARTADAVVHAGIIGGEDAAPVDRMAVTAMVEVLAGTGRPFVYTSGAWVLGAAGLTPATEATPANPLDIVAWRPGVEAWIREARTRAVRTVSLRPGVVYGGDGGMLGMMARGELPLVGDGSQRWTLVHRADLADLYLRAVEADSLPAVLHGVAHHRTAREIFRSVAGASVPAPVSLEEARQALGPFADALALDQWVSARATRDATGWAPMHPAPGAEGPLPQPAASAPAAVPGSTA